LLQDQVQAGAQPVPALLERRDARVAAADLAGDGGRGKWGSWKRVWLTVAREVDPLSRHQNFRFSLLVRKTPAGSAHPRRLSNEKKRGQGSTQGRWAGKGPEKERFERSKFENIDQGSGFQISGCFCP
jgi:hypothetical protein